MNKFFKAKLKPSVAAVVSVLGIIFTPLNAEAASDSSAKESYRKQPTIGNVATYGDDVLFASRTADDSVYRNIKHVALAKEQIDKAFVDFHSRVGDEALSLKHLSDRVANHLQDVVVDSVMVTGDADDGYLNIRLNVPGHTIISMIVDAEDPLVPVNIYYSGHLMASDVADLNDIHSMLIAVQNRNV